MQRYSWRWVLADETGGSKAPTTTVVQPPPPTVTQLPQPNVGETSSQLAQSQLQWNPQLTAQQVQLQGQYGPQIAQQQFDLQNQFGPLYKSLYQQLLPTQTQGLETLAQQANQRLASPYSLTPDQQMAQDAIRQRQRDDLSRQVRSRANVGGTLYGGNAIEQENRAQADLSNQYAMSDIALQQQQRQQALQEFIAAQQAFFPTVQQPNVPGFGQSVTPSPDALLQALQNSIFVQPAAIGFGQSPFSQNAGLAGSIFGAMGQAAGAACHVAEVLYGINDPRTHLARLYVLTHNSLFTRLYRGFSDVWAGWVKRVPILRTLVKPIWDRMWWTMLAELRTS